MKAIGKPTDYTVTITLNAAEVDSLLLDAQMLSTLAMAYRGNQGIERACPRLSRLLTLIAEEKATRERMKEYPPLRPKHPPKPAERMG